MKNIDFVDNCPEITEEMYNNFNKNLFHHYLFYKKTKDRIKCYCTHCRKEFEIDRYAMVPIDNSVFVNSCNHNESVECPNCGKTVTAKAEGVSRGGLYQHKFLVISFVKENEIFLIVGQAFYVRCE